MTNLSLELVDRLRKEFAQCSELVSVGGGAANDEISALAAEVGAALSPAYRQFLELFGSGIVGSLPIYGTSPLAMYPKDGTAADVTRRFRSDGWPIAEYELVIAMDQAGNPIWENADGNIISYDHDVGGFVSVAPDFVQFISDLMDSSCAENPDCMPSSSDCRWSLGVYRS